MKLRIGVPNARLRNLCNYWDHLLVLSATAGSHLILLVVGESPAWQGHLDAFIDVLVGWQTFALTAVKRFAASSELCLSRILRLLSQLYEHRRDKTFDWSL